MISDTFVVNFATSIEIIAWFLSGTTGPPYSAVLTVSYPNTVAILCHAGSAACSLGVIDIGAVGDDGEEGENEGEYGGDTCPNGNAGAT